VKANFKNWFAGLPAVPGLLACGVRRANGKCDGFGDEKVFPPEKIEQLLKNFATLHEPLTAANLPAQNTTWAFEYGRGRFVARADKWLLLLLVAPETEAEQRLEQFAGEFLSGLS
jgi:hypothetical protein